MSIDGFGSSFTSFGDLADVGCDEVAQPRAAPPSEEPEDPREPKKPRVTLHASLPVLHPSSDVTISQPFAVALYNTVKVYQNYVYNLIELTVEQRTRLAQIYYENFDKSKVTTSRSVKEIIFPNLDKGEFSDPDKWIPLQEFHSQLEAEIKSRGGKVFIRSDDMSPKDATLPDLHDEDKKLMASYKTYLDHDYNDFHPALNWATRKKTQERNIIRCADDAMELLCKSTRIFNGSLSYHTYNLPFHLLLAPHDEEIDPAQEFRAMVNANGDIFAITTYAHVYERAMSPLLDTNHKYVRAVSDTVQQVYDKVKDYVTSCFFYQNEFISHHAYLPLDPEARTRVSIVKLTEFKTTLDVTTFPDNIRTIVSSYLLHYRKIVDFCVKVDTDTMKVSYVRFNECNSLDGTTNPYNFLGEDHRAESERDEKDRRDYDYSYVNKLHDDSIQSNAVTVRINELSLWAAFMSTKQKKGQLDPLLTPKVPYADLKRDFALLRS